MLEGTVVFIMLVSECVVGFNVPLNTQQVILGTIFTDDQTNSVKALKDIS